MSRESARVSLIRASLNNLPFCACDVQKVYLQDPSSEKYHIVCDPEFGLENVEKYAMIVRALYGGKHDGDDYWRNSRSAMEEM